MRKLLTLLAATLLLFSCKKDKEDEKAQIFPLKEGNQWTFSVKEYDEDGTLTDTYNQTRVIKGTQKINNQTYFVVVDAEYPDDPIGLFRSDDTKIYSYDQDLEQEVNVFKWPATEGEVLFSKDLSIMKAEVVASTGSTTINTYDSRKVTLNRYFMGEKTEYMELFVKPTVGPTGAAYYELNPSGSGYYKMSEEILTSFTLK
ncbi:hypothetical protein V9K67_14240 [Paraflavisolibacter sp. H34]|uniref:hypothetical protein n=1 Tax=Huijunlia imazamoxiresistens TaxID=3127457 RepID=UPI003018F8FB